MIASRTTPLAISTLPGLAVCPGGQVLAAVAEAAEAAAATPARLPLATPEALRHRQREAAALSDRLREVFRGV